MKEISINGTTVLVNMDKVCAIAENYIQFDGGHVIWGKIEDAPTVDAEPARHGYWRMNGNRRCECSVCHAEGNLSSHDYYCKNCGAKMDGVET